MGESGDCKAVPAELAGLGLAATFHELEVLAETIISAQAAVVVAQQVTAVTAGQGESTLEVVALVEQTALVAVAEGVRLTKATISLEQAVVA